MATTADNRSRPATSSGDTDPALSVPVGPAAPVAPATPTAGIAPAVEARSWAVGLVLLVLVFMCGAADMTIEMSASRLLAPYFGTSLFIWAILIGMIMVYLTVGFWVGGKLADRFPRSSVLYTLTGVAGLFVALIPIVSHPILSWSLSAFNDVSVNGFLGSLIGVVLLFSVPVLLLAFVSPFAIRLRSNGLTNAGGTAGAVSALSSLGSILGTLIPAFFLIPQLGTAATLYLTAVLVLVFSILGLLFTRHTRQAAISAAMLLMVLALALFAPRGLIKPPPSGFSLLYEKESAYNYIQVVKSGSEVALMLNEGHAIHSIYDPNNVLTGGPWDYWSVAPYFAPGFRPSDMKSIAMLGSAAGTAGYIATQVYGPIPVDGVEIDPDIVSIGRQYFGLDKVPNVVTHEQDARTYLQTEGKDKQWTVIGIDAYRQPYIPFHLTTKEFFQEVKNHLTPNGAAMINAGRTATDTRLVDALANTMLQVFPNVYIIDVPTMLNSMVIGTAGPTQLGNFAQNAAAVDQPLLKQIFDASLQRGNVREVHSNPSGIVFTDDKAPVEEVVDQIILGYIGDDGK